MSVAFWINGGLIAMALAGAAVFAHSERGTLKQGIGSALIGSAVLLALLEALVLCVGWFLQRHGGH